MVHSQFQVKLNWSECSQLRVIAERSKGKIEAVNRYPSSSIPQTRAARRNKLDQNNIQAFRRNDVDPFHCPEIVLNSQTRENAVYPKAETR